MSDNFTDPQRTASVSFRPNGIYYGIVTNVDEELSRVWVIVPRISTETEFGPLAVSSIVVPREGERVACVFTENRSENLVVLGVVRNANSLTFAPPVVCTSETRPGAGDVPIGTFIYETDTQLTYVWTGSGWGGIGAGGSFSAGNVFINTYGLGIGAPSTRMPLSVTATHVPIELANDDSGHAVFGQYGEKNLTLGTITGSGSVVDVDSIQARDDGSASLLKINPLGGNVAIGINAGTSGRLDVWGDVYAVNVSGNLNATQLATGTVPGARLSGAYTGITAVGTLGDTTVRSLTSQAFDGSIGGRVTLSPPTGRTASSFSFSQRYFLSDIMGLYFGSNPYLRVHVNGTDWYTLFGPDSYGFSFGKWPQNSLFQGLMVGADRYFVLMTQEANAHTYMGARPDGDVIIRPNNNDIANELRISRDGHELKGRLQMKCDGTPESAGVWFTSDDNVYNIGLWGTNVGTGTVGNQTIGLYAPGTDDWQIEMTRNGRLVVGGSGAIGDTNKRLYLQVPEGASSYFVVTNALGATSIAASNERFKDNIVDLEDPWATLDLLRPRRFNWKGEIFAPDDAEAAALYDIDTRMGFIVEEIEEVLPNLVEYKATEDGDSVADWEASFYRVFDLLALSIAGLKDLQERVSALES